MGLSVFGPGRIRLHLDDEDPDTPCKVYLGRDSATYDCAVNTGEIGGVELTDLQMKWLATFSDQAEDHYNQTREAE